MGLIVLIKFQKNFISTKLEQVTLRYRCTKYEFVYFLIFLTKIEYESSSPFPIESDSGLDFQNWPRYFDQLSEKSYFDEIVPMALRYRCTKYEFVYFLKFLTIIEYESSSPFPIESDLGLDFRNESRNFDQVSEKLYFYEIGTGDIEISMYKV